jgi:hypothetical protein
MDLLLVPCVLPIVSSLLLPCVSAYCSLAFQLAPYGLAIVSD